VNNLNHSETLAAWLPARIFRTRTEPLTRWNAQRVCGLAQIFHYAVAVCRQSAAFDELQVHQRRQQRPVLLPRELRAVSIAAGHKRNRSTDQIMRTKCAEHTRPTLSGFASAMISRATGKRRPVALSSCIVLFIATLLLAPPARADVLIDAFVTPQSAPGVVDSRNTTTGSDMIGGERDIWSYLSLSINIAVPGQLHLAAPSFSSRGGAFLFYDGIDHDPSSSFFGGLGSVDLTQGGVNDRFRFEITAIASVSATMWIDVRSLSGGSTVQVNLPSMPGTFDVPFASFTLAQPASQPVDFADVGFVQIWFAMGGKEYVTMDSIVTSVPEPSGVSFLALASLVLLRTRLISRVED
jgi:hypothetical protein